MTHSTIIYAHPYEGSFNHAILQQVQSILADKQESIHLIDLYQDNFNPVYRTEELALFNQGRALDPLVLDYQEVLRDTSRLIFIFPIWWADAPAIVKGFLDKVFLKTLAYDESKTGLVGRLTNIHEAVVISTSTAPTWYLKLFCGNVIGRAFLGHTLKGVGVRQRRWINFGNIGKSSAAQRQQFLNTLTKHL